MISGRLALVVISLGTASAVAGDTPLSLVNPFVGTDAHGHTFPGATAPFGMVQLSPDTRVKGWDACGGYHYSDREILGFSHTHLSGTGIPDYGDVLFTPVVGTGNAAPLSFRHEDERASPGYYSVRFASAQLKAELTASPRTGVHRYSFPPGKESAIVVDLVHGLGDDRVIETECTITADNEIAGARRSDGWAKDQRVFFVARFSRPIVSHVFEEDREKTQTGNRSLHGTHVRVRLGFGVAGPDPLVVKVGVSGVDIEGARRNLDAEAADQDFDSIRRNTELSWQHELGKITVSGGSREQQRTFYTALYHSMIAPNLFSDADGRYRGMDGKIRTAQGFDMYTVFSLWDTFRAEHPLLSIIDRQRTRDFVRSLLAKYDESGVLPVWELAANETWCMIGYHAVPVIVDAYVKGIDGFDPEHAFAAMLNSAMLDHYGLKACRERRYIPGDAEPESVSKTLEYAYDDWCIAEMARRLGRKEAREFSLRALQYRNVFDPGTGFMRAKVNGAWVEPFDPSSVTLHYTEANAWQYSFFAPQDISGLIGLYGGREAFIGKLDGLFEGQSVLTGRQQADITGMIGQYAQGNEPSHHVAYLYHYAGAPWKSQQRVRTILEALYSDRPDGLCGNDDCGQMSAWYVMSAIGLYQVTPGDPLYCIGSPIFDSVVIRQENGRSFKLEAEGNSGDRPFVVSATLNDRTHPASFIRHEELEGGGVLKLTMSSTHDALWGSGEGQMPVRQVTAPFVTAPYFILKGKTFVDSMEVRLSIPDSGARVLVAVNGEDPLKEGILYTGPFRVHTSTRLNAVAVKDGQTSGLVTAEVGRRVPVGTIRLHTRYSSQYTGGGDEALIDGLQGATEWRLGDWQGYEQESLDLTIDLGSVKAIRQIALGCLQDNNAWIFFPTEVRFLLSDDGKTFVSLPPVVAPVPASEPGSIRRDFVREAGNAKARFIRVQADNIGSCPPWHKGAGDKAWLFADEIAVEAD